MIYENNTIRYMIIWMIYILYHVYYMYICIYAMIYVSIHIMHTDHTFTPSPMPRVLASSCPGAKRPPEHSTVETPVPQSSWNLGARYSYGSNRPLKSGGVDWFSWFQVSTHPENMYIFPHKKGPSFLEKGNESSKPKPTFNHQTQTDHFFSATCSFSGWIGPSLARRNGNWWFVMPKV